MYSTEPIKRYILYLITECGLSVTLHPLKPEKLISLGELMKFNIHDNSYCTCVKSEPEWHHRCLEQQKAVLQKCAACGEGFLGVCYAGVREYVYPIYDHDEVIGFVSVGGYAASDVGKYITKLAASGTPSAEKLERAYATLKQDLPERSRLDTLILPLCHMLELAYLKEEQHELDKTPMTPVLRYIRQYYALELSVDDVCRQFSFSRSYFSHSFKKETGMTFREYLTEVRLGNAKRLLKYSSLSVTEIAFSTGFGDSNYFSAVFKGKLGLSPLAYRKKVKA